MCPWAYEGGLAQVGTGRNLSTFLHIDEKKNIDVICWSGYGKQMRSILSAHSIQPSLRTSMCVTAYCRGAQTPQFRLGARTKFLQLEEEVKIRIKPAKI